MSERRDLRSVRTHTGGTNMVSVVPHLRLSWGGTIGIPDAEIWTNTLKWANDQSLAPTRAGLAGAAAAAAAPLKTWFETGSTGIASYAKLRWVKLNYVLANGLQRDSDTVVYDLPTPGSGGISMAQGGPLWIQSYALTLRTGISRGRGHAGRIFPPVCGPTTFEGYTGYLPATAASAMALNFGTCIRDIRNAMNAALGLEQPPFLNEGVAYDLVVISASKTGDNRPPQSNEVVSVVCDRVPDIQHRRSNRLPRAEGTTVVIADIP
jgi:hypothetical protein